MGEDPPKYQVEDVLNKKKPPPQILDLNGMEISSKEDFKVAFDKIPDYKIRKEKMEETERQLVMLADTMRTHRLKKKEIYIELLHPTKLPEEEEKEEGGVGTIKQSSHARAHTRSVPEVKGKEDHEKDRQRRNSSRAEQRSRTPREQNSREETGAPSVTTGVSAATNSSKPSTTAGPFQVTVAPEPYVFANPCPPSMRGVRISELSSVDISWKMLTLARPTSKVDEDIFSKLVELDKLRLATRKEEEAAIAAKGGIDPFYIVMPPSASIGGVGEKLIKVCEECGEEFCTGTCIIFQYDSYQRLLKEEDEDGGEEEEAKKKKKRGKSGKKRKGEEKSAKKA